MSDEACLMCDAEVPHDLWGRRSDYPSPHPYTQAMQDEFNAGKRFERDTVRRLLQQAPNSAALQVRGFPARPTREQIALEARHAYGEGLPGWSREDVLQPESVWLIVADAIIALWDAAIEEAAK